MPTALMRITLAVLGCGAGLLAHAAARQTALDRYVRAPDPSYRYELVSTLSGPGYTAFVLDMVSQTWRKPEEVDRTEWRHWLTIIKPDQLSSDIALLFITGGSNPGKPPARADLILSMIATETRAVVAELRMVPNQPLKFAGDSMAERREDALIAYTWDRFLRTGDELWPARLPMTKAAVRAMDTVTAFCATEAAGQLRIERYVVAGGSKRGWTAWTTAAVDPRVVAIAPIVINTLNVERASEHHWRSYGFWAPALRDYVEMDIVRWMGTPELRRLMEIEDPYAYRERLSMPKFIVNSTGDEFFPPDLVRFYYDDLPGEKHLRFVPNTNHSLRGSDAAQSLLAYFHSIVTGRKRPQLQWTFEGEGIVRVTTSEPPSEVKLWQATNPKARDFRLETLGAVWTSSPVEAADGVWRAAVPPPPEGWTAYFLEFTFPSGTKFPFKFTTPVRVVPDRLPFPAPEPRRASGAGVR
ncbi:MAG: PhoPQ-activated pathogenicity-related family protein [Bryobacterales bacterium]|nr:PhoPQ-activated pathogenicity-related family protein [Bryobacteraceae bacterium]MDW8354715.1 PhoPQ-activated pathogenicity-related family protein [Bryobacterales bacterium]